MFVLKTHYCLYNGILEFKLFLEYFADLRYISRPTEKSKAISAQAFSSIKTFRAQLFEATHSYAKSMFVFCRQFSPGISTCSCNHHNIFNFSGCGCGCIGHSFNKVNIAKFIIIIIQILLKAPFEIAMQPLCIIQKRISLCAVVEIVAMVIHIV